MLFGDPMRTIMRLHVSGRFYMHLTHVIEQNFYKDLHGTKPPNRL